MVTLGDVLVGRYRIEAPLGSGGMATVFRAHDVRLGRDVAIKVLLPHLADDTTVVARFDREARALAAVRHANVIGVFDVEAANADAGHPPFLVLELADGGTLADRLRGGRLAPAELAPIVEAVAGGLAALHAAGLVHRDVKPANVLFAEGVPKLGDLGIARWADPSAATTEAAGLTTDGSILGTLRYLPPEAMEGATAGPAGDAYGLAALAFEALTGRPVRAGASLATIAADAVTPAPAPSTVAPDVGPGFDALFAEALAPDPARRLDPVTFAERFAVAAAAPVRQATGLPEPDADATVVRAVARPSSLALDPEVAASPAAVVAPPIRRPARAPAGRVGRAVRPSARTASRRSPAIPLLFLGAAALVVAAMVVAFANAGRDNGATALATATPSAVTPSPSASPSPSESPSPSPSASPSPTPSPTPDPALDAANDVRAAIAAAKGGQDGLKGAEARDLDSRLDRIIVDIRNGKRKEARDLAIALAARIDKLKVKGSAGERLRTTADALVDALGGA